MLKIDSKVRLLKRGGEQASWIELGKGTVRRIFTNKVGDVKFIQYHDKEWPDEIFEVVSVDSPCFRAVAA